MRAVEKINTESNAVGAKELEQRLITSDLGVKATGRIMEELNTAWREGKIKSGDEVLDFLKAEMKAYWPAESRELHFAPAARKFCTCVRAQRTAPYAAKLHTTTRGSYTVRVNSSGCATLRQ